MDTSERNHKVSSDIWKRECWLLFKGTFIYRFLIRLQLTHFYKKNIKYKYIFNNIFQIWLISTYK